ncbi:MAG: DUF6653 family protein [Halobacteriaceae archaeon]
MGLRERFVEWDWFWDRHANPRSGWSRLLATPLFVAAAWRRDRRLLVVAVLYALLNPVAFPPPEREDAWMTRVVRAERAWLRDADRPGPLAYPGVLNLLGGPVSAYALYAAYRRRPVRTVAATLAAAGLKFLFVGELVRRYAPDDENL